MLNRLIVLNIILALLAAIVLSHEALAAPDAVAFFTQQATVPPPLKFHSEQNVGTYRVTAEDIRRGYTDLAAAMTVSYRSDGPEMVIIEIASLGPEQIYMNDDGIMAYMVALPPAPATADLDLDLRIILPRATVAGVYPLNFYVVPSIL